MGYFAMDMERTVYSAVDTAIHNLKLWQNASKNDPCNFSYLIGMALVNLEDAHERIMEEEKRRAEAKKNETT